MKRSRHDQITALVEREAQHLFHTVRKEVRHSSDALMEDACQYAWAVLVRREDIDPSGPKTFSWLATIAIREGWRMAREQTATIADSEILLETRATGGTTIEDTVAAREALELLDQLKPQQREVLRLFAAGLSYTEIMEVTGQTYTWVNRHLTEARKAIRELRGEI